MRSRNPAALFFSLFFAHSSLMATWVPSLGPHRLVTPAVSECGCLITSGLKICLKQLSPISYHQHQFTYILFEQKGYNMSTNMYQPKSRFAMHAPSSFILSLMLCTVLAVPLFAPASAGEGDASSALQRIERAPQCEIADLNASLCVGNNK